MKRSEACLFISRFCESEFVGDDVRKLLLKARDIVVCKPNKILDVLALEDDRARVSREALRILHDMSMASFIDIETKTTVAEIMNAIQTSFDENCDGYLHFRCEKCPLYKGYVNG